LIAGLGFRSYARGRRLEMQMEIARQVQSELLPPATRDCEPMSLATRYRPAEQVSGDFYDVFRAGDERLAIVMGDVSGKGLPAAPSGRRNVRLAPEPGPGLLRRDLLDLAQASDARVDGEAEPSPALGYLEE
jgi:hypothetical protein